MGHKSGPGPEGGNRVSLGVFLFQKEVPKKKIMNANSNIKI